MTEPPTGQPSNHLPGLAPPGEPLLSEAEAAAVLHTAYQVITGIGIEVPDDDLRQRVLSQRGQARGTRIAFCHEEVDEYLRRWRERNGFGEPGWRAEVPWPYTRDTVIGLHVMPYSHTYHDPQTDQLVPLTAARVKEAVRILGTFWGENVHATVPGHPVDVPPALQPILQYKLGAQYNPAGGSCGWTSPAASAEYVYRLAEVMGQPITSAVVYVFSPLRLGGPELEAVIAHRDRLAEVHVGNMGSAGGSLPIFPRAALALAWAETIAGAMCLEALTGLPANWGGGIEPFDLRAQTIPFGAPEQLLFYRLSHEAGCWIRGHEPGRGGCSLLTMAKRPGAQAMLEKAAVAAYALSSGCTDLGAAGSLSADEVFSPVQLVLDCELRDWLTRVARGVRHAEDTAANAFELIREGLEAKRYAATDATLDHYRQLYWFPRHLRRQMLGAWRKTGCPTAAESARTEVLERLERATWVLPEPQFSQLEDIYDEACQKLT